MKDRGKALPLFCLLASIIGSAGASSLPPAGDADQPAALALQTANLDQCIEIALENNRRRPISRYAVEMAEAQHRQVLASYWPQINLSAGYQRLDEGPNFLFPSSTLSLPLGGTVPITIPGIGAFPVNSIEIPEQDVQLMARDSRRAAVDATWLLYDGGMRKGLRGQTQGLIDIMKQESRRTDLEIVDSVRRLYFGAVLGDQLQRIGRDTLARMEATLRLTETMYKEGSGAVKKTDWLSNKVVVETLRSMVALLEKNALIAQAALANTMGMSWDASIKPVDLEIPYAPSRQRLERLVQDAYQFNPDWGIVDAGIRAAEAALLTAKSGHYPKLAATAELHKWWNDYDAGVATDANKHGWSLGIGVKIPLFDGFLTRSKVDQTRAALAKIKQEQILLKEGIGLQIRDNFMALGAAEKSHQATMDAMQAAKENRDLNTRAYQHGLVDTEEVIRAQLVEALMSANHYKAVYDHLALQSQLDLLVGTEVLGRLQDN